MVYCFLFVTCILISEKVENEYELWEAIVFPGYSFSMVLQFVQSFEKIAILYIPVWLSYFRKKTGELFQKVKVSTFSC